MKCDFAIRFLRLCFAAGRSPESFGRGRRMKYAFVPLLAALSLLPVAGCGYRMGSIMHPQVKTVAVAAVVNDSTAYNVAAEMRGLLCEAYMQDGSLKVVSEAKADCIVYARVISVEFREVTQRSYDRQDEIFVPDEWSARVTVEFSVIIPGRRDPLIPKRVVTGVANFQAPGDMESSSRRGIRQACRSAAQTVVSNTTSAW